MWDTSTLGTWLYSRQSFPRREWIYPDKLSFLSVSILCWIIQGSSWRRGFSFERLSKYFAVHEDFRELPSPSSACRPCLDVRCTWRCCVVTRRRSWWMCRRNHWLWICGSLTPPALGPPLLSDTCNYKTSVSVHWVQPITSSVRTSTRLQRAGFFATKSTISK